jgi:hypothetical protein
MLWNRLIEVWRAPLIDDAYGKVRDWSNKVLVASVPASVQPLNADEEQIDRETSVTRIKVYIRTLQVENTDRIFIDPDWWEIEGDPQDWHFSNATTHTKCILRQVMS